MIYKGKDIGKLLKKVRESQKLTQEEFAVKVGKKRSYISRIENGEGNVNVKTLCDIVEDGLGGEFKIILEIN